MELELPWPPSENSYRRFVPGRRKPIISKEGRIYRLAVKGVVSLQEPDMMTGSLDVRIDLYPPDRKRRDIDNVLKALLDSMQEARVYRDDYQIERLLVERSRTVVPGGAVVVNLREVVRG